MIQKERENLFVLLRSYHSSPEITESSDTEINDLVNELEQTKESVVSMVLGLVRGSEKYKDWSVELKTLAVKAKPQAGHTKTSIEAREILQHKITQLLDLLELAQKAV